MLSSCKPFTSNAPGEIILEDSAAFRIVGYFMGPSEDVEKFDYAKMTHVIFCFAQLDGNKIALEDTTQEKTLQLLVAQKKKYPELKVLIALGGWSGCETCSSVFSSDSNRTAFARSVKGFLIKYELDGFDLDWESPVLGGKNGPGSPDDKTNFTSLIKALRNELPPPYELSFDANSFREYIFSSVDWNNVMPDVDFVNLMTYGLPNDKPGHTGHHTALYSSPFQKESVESGVSLLDSLKVPMSKIVIGAAFYGFKVKNVDSANYGLGQAGIFSGNPTYKNIVEQYTSANGYVTCWDSIAMAPYLYNKVEKTFITFDNAESCKLKTEYALEKRLGGIMFWKINGDTNGNELLDVIYQTSTK
jgi:chitinase